MADLQIQDISLWIVIVSAINYFLLYKKNKFYGGLVFIATGITAIAFSTTTTLVSNEKTLYTALGFIYLFIVVITFIYDLKKILDK